MLGGYLIQIFMFEDSGVHDNVLVAASNNQFDEVEVGNFSVVSPGSPVVDQLLANYQS